MVMAKNDNDLGEQLITSFSYYIPICLYYISITAETGTESNFAAESFARNDVCDLSGEP